MGHRFQHIFCYKPKHSGKDVHACRILCRVSRVFCVLVMHMTTHTDAPGW